MTTTTIGATWIPAGDTGAKLYNAIKTISDELTAVGVALHSDTGQIAFSGGTITPPPVAPANSATLIGYEIRKLVASGKSTLYLRVEYFVVATTANNLATYRVGWRILMGLGTDGAGNMIAASSTDYLMQYSSTTGPLSSSSMTTARPYFMASDGANFLTFVDDPARVGNLGAYAYGQCAIERTITPVDGTYNNEGWVAIAPGVGLSGVTAYFILNATSMLWFAGTQVPAQYPGSGITSSGAATTANLHPITVCVPAPQGPMAAAVGAYAADVLGGTIFTTTSMYGGTKTYVAAGPMYGSKVPFLSSQGVMAYRFD